MDSTYIKDGQQQEVTLAQLTEFEVHHFVVDASDLRFPVDPKQWPVHFAVATDVGNGLAMFLQRFKFEGDQVVAVYLQQYGCVEVHVLND